MKKVFYLFTLIAICLCFVQCETDRIIIPEETHHEYIDLGLSVKWAAYNVGATTPEESGGYFAWGEIEEKNYYNWNTYKYCFGTGFNLTKYCFDSEYGKDGFTDTKTTLDPQDDAATMNWGGNWRMPTIEEFEELVYECEWSWITQNGVNGCKVVGTNGNSIFLPAVGSMGGNVNQNVGDRGWYWSRSLADKRDDDPNQARYLGFQPEGVHVDIALTRRYGFSIRAVYP